MEAPPPPPGEILLLTINQKVSKKSHTLHDIRRIRAVVRKYPVQLKRITMESSLWTEKEQSINSRLGVPQHLQHFLSSDSRGLNSA